MQETSNTLLNETSDLLEELIPVLNRNIQILQNDINPQGGALQYLLQKEIDHQESLLQLTEELKEKVNRYLEPEPLIEPLIEPPRPTRRYAGDLTVVMENGQEICRQHVAKTFVEVIKNIGIEKVKSLGIITNAIPLIDTVKHSIYDQHYFNGYYIMTNTSTDRKIEQLIEIKRRLNLNIKVIDNRKR